MSLSKTGQVAARDSDTYGATISNGGDVGAMVGGDVGNGVAKGWKKQTSVLAEIGAMVQSCPKLKSCTAVGASAKSPHTWVWVWHCMYHLMHPTSQDILHPESAQRQV
jgi:hypothetical protein